ncbi:DNA polymerase zeta, partial [Coemansia sp. RSA 1200]
AGAASPTRFYIGDDDNLPSSQYSGVLVSHDLYHNDSRHHKSNISSQEIGPVVVDIDMIIKDKDHWSVSGTDVSGEDNTYKQHDYSSDSCTADSDGGSLDSCELSDIEKAWMNEELLRVEKEITPANEIANMEIPQLDGADDVHEDNLDKRKYKESKYQCGDILRKKHKTRKLRPLVLHSSKGIAPKALSDGLFGSARGKSITHSKDMCHVNSRSDVFIDIPHPEGSRIRRYQEERYHMRDKELMMDYGCSRQKIDQNNLTTRFGRLGLPSHVEHIHQEAELEMIKDVAKRTCQLDPDILCGYEVENGSWGYLVERAQVVYGIDLVHELSRVPNANIIRKRWQYREGDKGGSGNSGKQTRVNVPGRHMLNLWKIMRSELSLTSYTFENVVLNVLDEKVPCYSYSRLSAWLLEGPAVARIRVLRHLRYRAAAVLQIIDKANIVDRAAEFANVIGIDFMSVITRGSQFRVESLMARIAHPELFILSSPTREQVAHQAAAECLPLVLEPKSRYYTDPVVVLDFQSLYPSIMIAYNYCYSTCLGRIEDVAGYAPASAGDGAASRRFGFTSMAIPPGLLSAIGHQNITISPNGVMFVKSSIRKGLLARMLEEILESRVMLKEAISVWGKDNGVLYKKLDAWQLGLKLIANVTYGYTGASFSGRMPCVEVADSIVQTGRETLENAIRFIQSKHKTWGAEVVYGDTDSMFLHFPGKSRQTAFRLGQEIADAVTRLNPKPVKLKVEKVYQPCVLLTKKRYSGWMYTAADQAEPQLDVKGMELVRRDGCKIQQKILEGAIDVLFRENDLSLVKSFVVAQITKVLRREIPMEEFMIAKEVRLSKYLRRTVPAHAKVAKDMLHTRQLEPLHGERVPYFVISNGACDRLSDRVVLPLVLLKQPRLRLDYHYYINKQIIPSLDRVFSLIGQTVAAMPLSSKKSTAMESFLPPEEQEGEIRPHESKSDSVVTALRFSRSNAHQVIGSWTYDHVYLFDLNQSPTFINALHRSAPFFHGRQQSRGSTSSSSQSPPHVKRIRSDNANWTDTSSVLMRTQQLRRSMRGQSRGVRLLSRQEAPYMYSDDDSGDSDSLSSVSSRGLSKDYSENENTSNRLGPCSSDNCCMYLWCSSCRLEHEDTSYSSVRLQQLGEKTSSNTKTNTCPYPAGTSLSETEQQFMHSSFESLVESVSANSLVQAQTSVSFALRMLTDRDIQSSENPLGSINVSGSLDYQQMTIQMLLTASEDSVADRCRLKSLLLNTRASINATLFRRKWQEQISSSLCFYGLTRSDLQTADETICALAEIKAEIDPLIRDINHAIELNPLNVAAHYNRLLVALDAARFDTMMFIVAIQPLIRKPPQNSDEPDDSEPIRNRLRAEFGDMGFRLSELQTTIADAYDMVREKTAVVCKLAELICTVSTSALQETDVAGHDGPFSVVGRYLGTSEKLAKVVKRDSELALDMFEQSNYLLKDNTENGVDPTDYTSVMYGVVSFLKELMCESVFAPSSMPNIDCEGHPALMFDHRLFEIPQKTDGLQNSYMWHPCYIHPADIQEHIVMTYQNTDGMAISSKQVARFPIISTGKSRDIGFESRYLDSHSGNSQSYSQNDVILSSSLTGVDSDNDMTDSVVLQDSRSSSGSWPRSTREYVPQVLSTAHAADSSLEEVHRGPFDQCESETSNMHPVPVVLPCLRYTGHCNFHTIKDVNFVFGRYVASGSDDGNVFIWDKTSMEIISILQGDSEVVNAIEDHPFLPIIAFSGIDCEVQIFHLSQGGPSFEHRKSFPLLGPFQFAEVNALSNMEKDVFKELVYSCDPYIQDLYHSGHLLMSPEQLDGIRTHVRYSFPAVSTNKIDEKARIIGQNEEMRLNGLAHASLSNHIMNSILLGGLAGVQDDSSDSGSDDYGSMSSDPGSDNNSDEAIIIGDIPLEQSMENSQSQHHYSMQISSLSDNETDDSIHDHVYEA